MEILWRAGVICNCMYGNEEENEVIDNVEGVRVMGYGKNGNGTNGNGNKGYGRNGKLILFYKIN